jgi:hypothetical protein
MQYVIRNELVWKFASTCDYKILWILIKKETEGMKKFIENESDFNKSR